jgi:hypothetical protein
MMEHEPRKCGRCDQLKPVDDFNWRRIERGQRDNLCRACRADYHHEHYSANRKRYVDQARIRKQALVLERTRYLIEYFAAHPCADCGEADAMVLEFDHLRDKAFNIGSALPYRNWQSVLDEIDKCEVVCANCHRRRTMRRMGAVRAVLAGGDREYEAGDGTRTRDRSLEGSSVTATPRPQERGF